MLKRVFSILGTFALLAAVLVLAPGCADEAKGDLTIQGSGTSE